MFDRPAEPDWSSEADSSSVKEPQDLDDEALCAAVSETAAQLAAGESRLLQLIAEANRRELWWEWDTRRPADWVSFLTGFSPQVAKHHVEVASRLPELPATAEALQSGGISFCQAKAIAAAQRPDLEDELLHLAKQATTSQLQRVVRAYHRATALNDLEAANEIHEKRYLDYFFEESAFVLRGRLGRDDGSVVAKALDAFKDKLFGTNPKDSGESPPRESDVKSQYIEQVRADALVALAEAALDNDPQSSGADRHQVVIHVDYDALTEDAPDARCEIEGAGAIPTTTARRLTCDASVVWMLEKDGEPLSSGRKTRRVSTALRRALRARDRTCQFPGCNHTARLDAHHLKHWTRDGGETSPANLRLFCRVHHRLLHEKDYSVEVSPGGRVTIRRPNGTVVSITRDRPACRASDLAADNRAAGLEASREASAPWGAGKDKFDLAYITDTLFFQEPALAQPRRE